MIINEKQHKTLLKKQPIVCKPEGEKFIHFVTSQRVEFSALCFCTVKNRPSNMNKAWIFDIFGLFTVRHILF